MIRRFMKDIGFSIKNMNLNRDPFDNFYLYSCENWMKKNPLPKDRTRYGSFDQLDERNLLELKRIAEECLNEKKDPLKKKIGDLYYSFMNTKRMEELKFRPIYELMKKIDEIKDIDDINICVIDFAKIGLDTFFEYTSGPDQKEPSIYSFYVEQGGLTLPDRDYYLKEQYAPVLKRYREHITKMFVMYGTDKSEAERNAEAIMKIETHLAKASRSNAELRDEIKNYNRFSQKEIKRRFNKIDIHRFYSSFGIDQPFIVIGQPEFMDKVNKITDLSGTDEIKAYLRWRVLRYSVGALHSAAYNESFSFFGRFLTGQKKPPQRWKRGVMMLDELVGEAIGKLYVEKYFSPDAKKKAEELIDDLLSAFRERLSKVKWMSEETKRKALEKLDALNPMVGYPKKFRDYSSLKIKRDDFFGNYVRSMEFETRRLMSRVGKKVDKEEWLMTPQTVNAYCEFDMNEIVITAGILQPPFFDEKKDAAVNYGGIGGVISHEITHAFDDQGSLHDKEGRLKEWWKLEDRRNFKKAARKVEKYYSSFEILPGIKLNGKLTLGENIADLGGIAIAYDALSRYLKRHPSENRIIEGFTPFQRFYISWSQIWKQNITEKAERVLSLTDPHSPGKIRGLVPVITHPNFEETFREKSRLKHLRIEHPHIGIW